MKPGFSAEILNGVSISTVLWPEREWPQRAEVCTKEKERPMNKRRSTPKRRSTASLRTGGRRRVVALVLLLSLVCAGAILGQRLGTFSQTSRKKPAVPQQEAGIIPANFDAPSKEYIFAGQRLIATEEGQSSPPPPTPGSSTPGLYAPQVRPSF